MAKSHMTMKDLKHDALQDAGRSAFDYLRDHGAKMLAILGAVILVVLVVRVALGISQSRRAEATELINQARNAYGRAVYIQEPTERDRALETAVQDCMNVRMRFASSEAARRSYLLEGNCEMLRGNFRKALEAYEQFESRVDSHLEKAEARLAMGHAWENMYFQDRDKQDLLDSARKAYEQASQAPAGAVRRFVNWEAMLALARVHRIQGDLGKAADIYREVAEQRPYFEGEASDEADEEGRAADAAQLRESVREALAMMSFEKEAERRLEEVEARMPDEPAAAAN